MGALALTLTSCTPPPCTPPTVAGDPSAIFEHAVTSRDYAARGGHYSAGEHGYDNAEPDMAAVFVAHGPAFRRGVVLPTFDGVDVYPLLAHLLGIRPAANDGDFSAVVGALREDPRAGAARSATSP